MNHNNLLKSLRRYRSEEISILVRHAHRYIIPKGVIEHHNIPLTPEGRVMACEFGKKLPTNIAVRLFHSPIPRCKETAECIREGVISNNGSAEMIGERRFLGTHAIVNLNKMIKMMESIGGLEFVRRWLNGEIDRTIMKDPHRVVSEIVEGVINSKKEKNSQRTIDLHVTHDLNIISTKTVLLNVKIEQIGWADYLDGIVFVHYPNSFVVTWDDITRTISQRY